MSRNIETGGEGQAQHRSFSGGGSEAAPQRSRVVSPHTVRSADAPLPTAFINKDGTPKRSGDQSREQGPVARGVAAYRKWREGRTAQPAPAAPRPIRFTAGEAVVPEPVPTPASTPDDSHQEKDTPEPVDDASTQELPIVTNLTPEAEEEALADAEDASIVRTFDWLMANAANGDREATAAAGRLLSLAELRGGGLMGKLEKLADSPPGVPPHEPSAADLKRLDDVFDQYEDLPEAVRSGLIEEYNSDFDFGQLTGLRNFTRDLRAKKEGRQRVS